MSLKLFSIATGQEIGNFTNKFKIGRVEGNDLIIPDESISRKHAELTLRGADWILHDTGSTNGTRLNGTELTPSEPYIVRAGDKVSFGSYQVEIFEYDLIRSLPTLLVFNNFQYEGSFGISDNTTFSYGGPKATIKSTYNDENLLVFLISKENNSLTLSPRGDFSHLYYNGKDINDRILLKDKDQIKIGTHIILTSINDSKILRVNPSDNNEKEEVSEMPNYLKDRIGQSSWVDPLEEKKKNYQGNFIRNKNIQEDISTNILTSAYSIPQVGSQRFSTPNLETVIKNEELMIKKYAIRGIFTLVALIGMLSVLLSLYSDFI